MSISAFSLRGRARKYIDTYVIESDIGTDTGNVFYRNFLPRKSWQILGLGLEGQKPANCGNFSDIMLSDVVRFRPVLGRLPRFAKIGGSLPPEKPCPWHAEVTILGRLTIRYCDVGPEGHEGSHIGDRPRFEYLRLLRLWKRAQNGSTTKEGTPA